MSKTEYFTEEGLQALKDKLHHLKTVERPLISEQIAEARDKGDLSENAEYHAAKEAQSLMEARISELELVVRNARVIDSSVLDTSKALIHCKVTTINKKTGKEMTFTLVAQNEADIKAGKLSLDSPIGKGLLGHKVGEVVDIATPAGVMQFEITNITR